MSRTATAANQHKRTSTRPVTVVVSNGRMRTCQNKGFVFSKLKGMGCKSIPFHFSDSDIVRPAAELEAKGSSKKRNKEGSKQPANVAVDVPDMCCAPPGIGFSSRFPTRNCNRNQQVHRNDRHFREARRTGNGPGTESRDDHHRFADEIIGMMMSQQALLCQDRLWSMDDENGVLIGGRTISDLNSITRVRSSSLRELDPYHEWRLDVDKMSYEELLDLGDRIGYVATGLKEEDIPGCLSTVWRFDDHFAAPPSGDWKCSICQEKYARNNDIGVLGCGHHHHVDCIKQWLLKKNSCPTC